MVFSNELILKRSEIVATLPGWEIVMTLLGTSRSICITKNELFFKLILMSIEAIKSVRSGNIILFIGLKILKFTVKISPLHTYFFKTCK